ncbi:MAG: DUF4286 family protein [Rikenellaceae bacterium]
MYIINTTFVVEPAVHGRWYEFCTQKFIPHLQSIGMQVLVFSRILHEESTGHYSYSLQINAPQISDYQQFMREPLAEYVESARAQYGEQTLHFTTLLKKIPLSEQN